MFTTDWDIPGIYENFKASHCQLTMRLRNSLSARTNILSRHTLTGGGFKLYASLPRW